MTLLVCLTGKDGLVLGTDSRGTFGDPREVTAQNDTMRKAYPLTKHVGVMVAGDAGLGAKIMSELEQELAGSPIDGATPVMEKVRLKLVQRYSEWFPGFLLQPAQGSDRPVRPTLDVIVAGYELADGKATVKRMYSMASGENFAPNLHDYGWVVDGIPQYALYLLNRLYVGNASVEDLTSLACYAITETASQDGKVGGPIQLLTISEADGCASVEPQIVDLVIKRNSERSEQLRRAFYTSPDREERHDG